MWDIVIFDTFFSFVSDTEFPHIVPDRLQFFEYDFFNVTCEADAFSKWRVMRQLNQTIASNSSNCNTSAPSCSIYPAFKRDSGEYWCENEEGQRSNSVNIAVTGMCTFSIYFQTIWNTQWATIIILKKYLSTFIVLLLLCCHKTCHLLCGKI